MSRRLRRSIMGLIFSLSITMILFLDLFSTQVNKTQWRTNSEQLSNKFHCFSDRIEFQQWNYLLEINGNVETTIECLGHGSNQSCLIRNFYFYQQTFWILTTKVMSYPLLDIRIGAWISYRINVNQRRFYSYADLEEFVRIRIKPVVIPNVTVYFDQPWLANIGHALFDGLYPAYVALIRFSPRHLRAFRILLSGADDGDRKEFSKDVYRRFSGLGIINMTKLQILSNEEWFAFEEIVVGSGDFCQRCLQANLQLPGGITFNASRLFRDRMYRQYGFEYSHSIKRRHSDRILNAFIIDNKRFTHRDKQQIHLAIEQIKSTWPYLHISYIDFNFTFLNMTQKMFSHLQLLNQIDIHVSGPGTAQMYQTFLSDGSVNINLGAVAYLHLNDTSKNYTTFMEQYVTSGTPYIKGIYYPINQRTKGIQKNILIQLLREAVRIIRRGFSIPVNPYENLAPDGQLFVELCRLDSDFCASVTERWRGDHYGCIDTWPEEIIHQKGVWSTEGARIEQGKWVFCQSNRTLIKQLITKYNITSPSSIF